MSASSHLIAVIGTQCAFLRKALLADALLTGLTGIMAVFGSGMLAKLLGLRPWIIVVIASNALWVAGSFLLLLLGWIDANVLGKTFIIGQALIVAVLAELEFMGLRRLG